MQMIYTIRGSMEYLSQIYRWCCDQWPNDSSGWDIVNEYINWQNGDLTVTYSFTDTNKSMLFCLVWMNSLDN